jgi:ubiquinone/menaquinone biosynthesis C-methylase UbiE
MTLWDRWVLPHLIEWGMRSVEDLRAEALAQVHGEVLEIGFGTGLNLPHYPAAVRSLVALDPLDALRDRVDARIERAPFPVERVARRAEARLPFDAGRFDCVVTTWTLCSIADGVAVLEDARRVLKSGGLYAFIEHGRSDDPRTARWQVRLTPIHSRVAGGCRLDRPIDEIVRKSGLALERLDRFVAKGPRIFSEMYRGVARSA